jgi:hypothetical protein
LCDRGTRHEAVDGIVVLRSLDEPAASINEPKFIEF